MRNEFAHNLEFKKLDKLPSKLNHLQEELRKYYSQSKIKPTDRERFLQLVTAVTQGLRMYRLSVLYLSQTIRDPRFSVFIEQYSLI